MVWDLFWWIFSEVKNILDDLNIIQWNNVYKTKFDVPKSTSDMIPASKT